MAILLDPDARPVVAHRGNSAYAPENTLESLRQGAELGADAIEFDVRLSRDGHAVVIHDPTLERTTSGEGSVAGASLAELRSLDAGFHFTTDGGRTFPWRGRGLTVPALDDVLAAFPATPMIIEIKTAAAAVEARRLLLRHGAALRCIIGSFSDAALAPFRESSFACGAARHDVVRLYLRALAPGGPDRLPYQVLCIPPSFRGLPLPVQRFARMAHRCGVPTHVWTVNDPARARRYWSGAVNAIISNDPAAILATAGRIAVLPSQKSLA